MSAKQTTSWLAVLPALVIPTCLGLSMYMGLMYMIEQSIVSNELLERYTTGHPISRFTTAMFFVGCASLLIIAKNVFDQFSSESRIALDESEPNLSSAPAQSKTKKDATAEDVIHQPLVSLADRCQQNLDAFPAHVKTHYLWQRLASMLSHLRRSGTTKSAENELKYLSELDLERQQHRYALVRILIWATPMLGFLGTVLGISEALGGIAVGPDNDFESMMNGLRGSLYVAFDTTALALTLSMLMMFGQFLIDRFETQLLTLVDSRAHAEIAKHFDLASPVSSEAGQFSNQFLAASKQAVIDQTKIWAHTIHSAEKAWTSTLTDANAHVQDNLTEALHQNFALLNKQLANTIDKADNAMAHRWQQWQVTLSENCRLLADHQSQLSGQTELISELVSKQHDNPQLKKAATQHEAAIKASQQLHASMSELAESLKSWQPTPLESRTPNADSNEVPAAASQDQQEANFPRLYQPESLPAINELSADSIQDAVSTATEDKPQIAQRIASVVLPSAEPSAGKTAAQLPAKVAVSSEVTFASSTDSKPARPAFDSIRQASDLAESVLSKRRLQRRRAA